MKVKNMIEAENLTREACRSFYLYPIIGGLQGAMCERAGARVEYEALKIKLEKYYYKNRSAWCKAYLKTNYSHFSHCVIYKVLMGKIVQNKASYNYQPAPF